MFGRQRQSAALEEPALPEVPQPMRLSAVDLGDATLQQYEQVAQSIGFHNPALLEQQICDFFFRNAICVYPYDKVSAYLDALVEVEKKRRKNRELVWCWKSLRKSDVGKLQPTRWEGNGLIVRQQYAAPVPLQALQLVQKITTRFPKGVYSYVSDIAVPRPDPFLAITAPGLPWFVIDHWDEPAFNL